MLRVHQSDNAEAAANYFTESLVKGDYYLSENEQEIIGKWGGVGAARLGLAGTVERDDFIALVYNKYPPGHELDGETITGRQRKNRTPGYDFTFSVPKSVSVIHGLTGDERIVTAFRECVHKQMQIVERDMATRVRKGGKDSTRQTGEMIWAEFTHKTARPVDGLPDPQLHAHMYALNLTHDAIENQWKAGYFRELKRDSRFYEASFHADLSKRIEALGYDIIQTGDNVAGWAINHVPESVEHTFSRRTSEIDTAAEIAFRELEMQNATDEQKAKLKDGIGRRSRQGKEKDYSMFELRESWNNMLEDEERHALHIARNPPPGEVIAKDAKQALDYALAHCLERKSVVDEKELKETALRYGVGAVTLEEIEARLFDRAGDYITGRDEKRPGRVLYSTMDVHQQETEMVSFARNGKAMCPALNAGHFEFEADFLNDGQKGAVMHALTSHDRVMIIEGGAGTGKTTLMKEAVRGMRENGYEVFAFAPSAEASRGVLRDEGFENADTVAALLQNQRLQQQINGQVIMIDEAGLLSVPQMNQVFKIAEQQNARVLLTGDVKQFASVERGDALRILQDEAKCIPARVTEIQRQRDKPDYKAAVGAISKGEIVDGFNKLDAMGSIVEYEDVDQMHTDLANEYLAFVQETHKKGSKKGQFKTALVEAPTHRECDLVADKIRAGLRNIYDDGTPRLGKLENEYTRLKNNGWTEPQRGNYLMYRKGQVLQFHQNSTGIKRSDRLVVSHVDNGSVFARNAKGETRRVPLEHANRFSVFDQHKIKLAVGDQIRITQNGQSLDGKRLNNNDIFTVNGFTEDGNIGITSKGGASWVLDRNHGNFAYGYAVTRGQGITRDGVFIAQSDMSFRPSSMEQFYVAVSRGREHCKVFTNDKDGLLDAVNESGRRMSAIELFNQQMAGEAAAMEKPPELGTYADRAAGILRRNRNEEWTKDPDPRRMDWMITCDVLTEGHGEKAAYGMLRGEGREPGYVEETIRNASAKVAHDAIMTNLETHKARAAKVAALDDAATEARALLAARDNAHLTAAVGQLNDREAAGIAAAASMQREDTPDQSAGVDEVIDDLAQTIKPEQPAAPPPRPAPRPSRIRASKAAQDAAQATNQPEQGGNVGRDELANLGRGMADGEGMRRDQPEKPKSKVQEHRERMARQQGQDNAKPANQGDDKPSAKKSLLERRQEALRRRLDKGKGQDRDNDLNR